MSRRFRAGALERDFHILFDEKAMWKWPFKDGGVLGTLISLAITTFIFRLFLGIFVNLPHGKNAFAAMMGIVFLWELLRVNWRCLIEIRQRQRLKKKYFPVIQHTEAFDLLQDAIASRRKGTVEGLGSKEETEANLIRLWKAAFAEAGTLSSPQSPTDFETDPLDALPVADHINRYFEERATSYQEINA